MAGEGEGLPGVATPDEPDIVLHVDMDCFYAACERLRDPALEGEPVVVGMGFEPGEERGAVATASYEAREFGVESAMPISEALERLPRRAAAAEDPEADAETPAYYRPVDMAFYRSVAADVEAVLRDCADVVRAVSIDEAYLDVTDRTSWAVAEGFARHVKDRIPREAGVTASVGVAPTMSAAKVASDHDKPDGLVVVRPGEVEAFLAPLPIEALHGIGPVTADDLRGADIETIGDLAGADEEPLVDHFGDRGRELHRRARGIDERTVAPVGEPKSLSRESSFAATEREPERHHERVRTLARSVADRARHKGAMYRTIGIKAITPPYDVNTRERSLPGPVDDPELVESIALELIEEFAEEPLRKVGVRVSNLSFDDHDQADLEAWPAGSGEGVGIDRPPGRSRRPRQTSLTDYW